MISAQVLSLFLVIVPCASQYAPGFGCNDTFLMVELHKCEKTMLQALIDDPSANCREEVKKLQQCSRKLIVDRCYSSLYALYPKLRKAVEKMMDVTLKQVNKASFYCSDHKMKINWEMIPHAVKKVLPCDKRFFEESLQCAGKFRAAFNKNKKDPNLCRLYKETKQCSHRISYIYCTSSSILSLNKLNPFCEGGKDLKGLPNDMSVKKKPLKCMVQLCSNSSSPFFPSPPCAAPKEITCATPKELPFEYDSCMTTRITIEPVAGVIVTQVNRNCSSSFLCKYDVFCNTANRTGVIQSCNVDCCEGELCNRDNSYQTKIRSTKTTSRIQATKRKVSSSQAGELLKESRRKSKIGRRLQCMSYYCSNSSTPLHPFNSSCIPLRQVMCESLGELPHGLEYDACMSSRLLMEPVAGMTVAIVNRNCTTSLICNSNTLCNLMNSTGTVKQCDINCCKGDLCNNESTTQTNPHDQAIKPKVSSLKCVSSECHKSSNPVLPSRCSSEEEVKCNRSPGGFLTYDRCITSRILMEPVPGMTVEQEIRNCSYSFLCQSFCNAVNGTALVKKCDVKCCEGNLCNKKGATKTTPAPQAATTKVFSPLIKIATPTKTPAKIQEGKPLICMVYSCSNSSSPLFSAPLCAPPRERMCIRPQGLPFGYDACMTTRVEMEPIAGVIVEQEIRDCSSSLQCDQPKRFCDIANKTGLVKKCDVQCCKDDLCNKKEGTKPTLKPRSVTQKVPSQTKPGLPKEYLPKFKKGFWTEVTPSWISGHLLHGVRVKYRSVHNGLVIEGHVTSFGCNRRPGSGLTTFIRGNWTRIMYTQEFMGSASCWRIFGNSGRKGGYKKVERSGLEEFDTRKGDIVFNELKMGGKDHDAFNGRTHMCGHPAKNFWHAQNGQGLRRATVMLRRKTDGSKAGIHIATSCGQPSFIIKDIFIYH